MLSKSPIGIIQGRLLPPIDGRIQCFPAECWREEFPRAVAAGVDLIEWIYEIHGADLNPISTDDGIAELRILSEKHGIAVRSLCADYFMDRPLLSYPGEGLEKLSWLLERCYRVGIKRIILPFVDVSKIRDKDSEDFLVDLLLPMTASAQALGIELHLETDLTPVRFFSLMNRLPESVFKINYDSGNSASHGYNVEDEFAVYGSRIGSLHIKDRVLGGGTVPLGTGNTDFKGLRSALESIDYCDDVILQVARSEADQEIEWIREVRFKVIKILDGKMDQ